MENNYLFIVGLIVLVVEAIAAYFLLKNRRIHQLISQTETSRISNIRNGFYEIKGRVVAIEPPLITPFSKKACVYYDFLVEEKRSSGKNSSWVKYLKDVQRQRFGVDDSSGIAVIDTTNAEMKLRVDLKDESDMFNKADEHQKEVLGKYGKKNKGLLFEKTLRYREIFLEEGDEVYVLGEVSSRDNSRPLFKKLSRPLFVSDKTEDELQVYFQNRVYISIAVMVIAALVLVFLSINSL